MWHVLSRSGVATLRTAIHLLLTYLLTYLHHPVYECSTFSSCLPILVRVLSLLDDRSQQRPERTPTTGHRIRGIIA